MENNYFYETPRLPMFFLMEDDNIVRVRVLRYNNGRLDGVLADWNADNIQDYFLEKDNWNSKDEEPFYCLYKRGNDIMYWGGFITLKEFSKEESKLYGTRKNGEEYYPTEDLYKDMLNNLSKLHCPIFDSIEEANDYVFGNK